MLARLLLMLGMLSGFCCAAEPELAALPPLTGHVVDTAGLLQATQAEALAQRLRQFEQQHGSQIVVLIVPTVQPESIEQYSMRVFDAWKIGRKQANDGVLLLVAVRDRKLRIDTGYGLEGALPDAIAKRIVADIIAPRFKAGDPYAGLQAGLEQILKLVEGEQLPAAAHGKKAQSGDGQFGELLVLGIVAATIVGGVLSLVLGRFFGSLATAGIVGAITWFMTASMLVMTGSAVLVFLYVLVTGGRGGSSIGGWGTGHGGHRGMGGGWSSGGGSWGGGGGSAGGGGASGGW
jgi:uncharacterized protein